MDMTVHMRPLSLQQESPAQLVMDGVYLVEFTTGTYVCHVISLCLKYLSGKPTEKLAELYLEIRGPSGELINKCAHYNLTREEPKHDIVGLVKIGKMNNAEWERFVEHLRHHQIAKMLDELTSVEKPLVSGN